MNNKNCELYKKHKHKIFEMMCEILEESPIKSYFATDIEEQEYEERLNIFTNQKKEEIKKKLAEMGFELKDGKVL